MKYLTVKEFAEKWHLSERRIQKLCTENRIEGVIRFGHSWAIPEDAKKPADRRFHLNNTSMLDIDRIVKDYGTYIYNFALKLSGNTKDAEDLAQETFIKAWKNIETLKNPKSIKKWLRTICLNEFRMKINKDNRMKIDYTENIDDLIEDGKHLMDVSPTLIDETFVNEEVSKIRDGCFLAMVRKLSINQRIAFSLVYMFGLPISEVAKLLQVTPKAVKGLLYRARMNLDSFFQGHCSILEADNPCKCSAWVNFVNQRADLQNKLKKTLDILDYRYKDYSFDEATSAKVLYYYQNMPEYEPSDEWFESIIVSIRDLYKISN
ncbi:sigma-70 family RNA polymerase sigma factor [Faecalicatena faecalis]